MLSVSRQQNEKKTQYKINIKGSDAFSKINLVFINSFFFFFWTLKAKIMRNNREQYKHKQPAK